MPYTYLGGQMLTYPAYADAATGRMLIGDPAHDGPYDLYHVDTGLSDPPPDGRWAYVAPLPPQPEPVLPEPAPVPAPEPAPAPEGGVS